MNAIVSIFMSPRPFILAVNSYSSHFIMTRPFYIIKVLIIMFFLLIWDIIMNLDDIHCMIPNWLASSLCQLPVYSSLVT